ncbi:hypothetical protein ABB37_02113 [Leptomonas pyrrhocoris]|uniref:SET domain-containing protein n=1 Tax=Leptomonas pyrrhocoris TaxID=157538 RepID=A0A0M9G791_LEPPY|nr:hypothetical protein ABB37_02113 [Leptomonas pyrrhocoris]XP_015662406.1 hypothetical protein ABB37_02113 [Leptomonas pyrrhocoris]KPA83966.1 hypothetical protein ABB37_02113 [Leptomonas pyrrhocoris]KPA83967.1 hypothetical protein ABB37_02113 [Leptomonas pyrrhocoris]|eukprot:XP_015662405.1 hypothetical protein ABB37_02113 [Leptomonas pyrrhocoris]
MDPAVKAANELNAIFGRLEVPCEVCVTSEAGKHMMATADLDRGFALVEELPIVSWPSVSFLNLRLPFCFHCLRLATHQLSPADDAAADGVSLSPSPSPSSASTAALLPEKWSRCAQCASCFCSVDCQQASARTHRLLCSPLPQLRSDANGSSATVASGISVEALARCVAWIAQRLSVVIEQQKLTHAVLQADYTAQRSSSHSSPNVASAEGSVQTAWSADSLNYQLFTQVVAPFSRLISPPDSVQFDGVSLPAWGSAVRLLLAEKCVKLLLVASGAPLAKLQLSPLRFETEMHDDPSSCCSSSAPSVSPSASPLYWAEALVHVLLSADTLRTLVGQMVLNAHGVNDYVLPVSAAAPGKFEWVLKGAGLYTLLSSFNHSCEPNAAVSNVDDTHEIALTTTRPVKTGEEITITYIPLTASATLAERRQLLKSYLFTCRCSRCVREEKACAVDVV